MSLPKSTDTDQLALWYFFSVAFTLQACTSCLMISLDYFNDHFPKMSVTFIFPIAMSSGQIIISFIINKLSGIIDYFYRVIFPVGVVGSMLLAIPYETYLLGGTQFGFYLVVAMIFVFSFCSNLAGVSMLGIAARLPGQYVTSALIGSGCGALSMAVLRQIAKMIFAHEKLLNVLAIFILGATFAGCLIVLHYKFVKSDFYQEKLAIRDYRLKDTVNSDDEASIEEAPQQHQPPKRDWKTYLEVFYVIKLYPSLVALIFIQMFMVFPGVMLKKPTPDIADDTKVITMNFVFSVFFLLGKKLAQFRHLYSSRFVIGVVLFRFILMSNFILQVIGSHIPIINTLTFAYINVLFFGLTNGFAQCSLYILAPEQLPPEKKEVAGFVNAFGLAIGTGVGVLAALPFKNLRPGSL